MLNCSVTKPSDIRRLWHRCDAGCGASSYDKRTRPQLAVWVESGAGQLPAPKDRVYVSMQLNSLMDVNVRTQTYKVELFTRTIWWDPRLSYDGSCIAAEDTGFDGKEIDEIWTPQLFTKSAASPPTVDESAFWVFPSGQVWWLQKVYAEFKCPMDFTHMPFDTQRCTFEMESFRFSAKQLDLTFPDSTNDAFMGLGPVAYVCADPKAVGGTISWNLVHFNGSIGGRVSQTVDEYSKLTYSVHFTRVPDTIIETAVLPMFSIMLIVWSSFFITRAAVPARVAMAIIAYLALVGKLNAIQASLPERWIAGSPTSEGSCRPLRSSPWSSTAWPTSSVASSIGSTRRARPRRGSWRRRRRPRPPSPPSSRSRHRTLESTPRLRGVSTW